MLQDHSYTTFSPKPTIFHSFKLLPPELRIKIWRDVLPGARTIHLVKNVAPTVRFPPEPDLLPLLAPYIKQRGQRKTESCCKATMDCPIEIMSLLHCCQESRHEAAAIYQPLCAPKSLQEPRDYRLHYFDPLIDQIFVEELWPWVRGGHAKPTGVYNARHLSISCNSWHFRWVSDSVQLFGKAGLLRFKHLETLNIVFRILTDQEKVELSHYRFGRFMSPADMTNFLRRPEAPYDIAFPGANVDIQKEKVVRRFAEMKKANPTWNVPEVKLVAWGTRNPRLRT